MNRSRTSLVIDLSGEEDMLDLDDMNGSRASVAGPSSYNKKRKAQAKSTPATPSKPSKASVSPNASKKRAMRGRLVYRQPAFRIEADVQKNAVWLCSVDKVERQLRSSTSTEATARAQAQMAKLHDFPGFVWGVIEPKQSGRSRVKDPGGPCASCAKDGIDCLVKVAKKADGCPGPIGARCIGCDIGHMSCDIVQFIQPPRSQAEAALIAHPSPPDSPRPRKSGRVRSIPQALADVASHQPQRRRAAPAPRATVKPSRKTVAAPSSTRVRNALLGLARPVQTGARHVAERAEAVNVVPPQPRPNDEQITAALSDLREFSQHMQTVLKAREALHFAAKMLFEDAEERIGVIQRYTLPFDRYVTPVTSNEAVEAMRQIRNFAKDLQDMEPESGKHANMMAVMFKKLQGRIDVLQKVVDDTA